MCKHPDIHRRALTPLPGTMVDGKVMIFMIVCVSCGDLVCSYAPAK